METTLHLHCTLLSYKIRLLQILVSVNMNWMVKDNLYKIDLKSGMSDIIYLPITRSCIALLSNVISLVLCFKRQKRDGCNLFFSSTLIVHPVLCWPLLSDEVADSAHLPSLEPITEIPRLLYFVIVFINSKSGYTGISNNIFKSINSSSVVVTCVCGGSIRWSSFTSFSWKNAP